MFDTAPHTWERITLGEIVARSGGSIQTGPFGSQLHASDYVPVGIPCIMPVNIGDNRLVRDGIACIRPSDAERLARHIVRKGDIIYSRRGDVERRALVREAEDGWFCGTGCLKLRLGEGVIEPEFASYYLGHPEVRGWIVRHAVGATMPNLNTSIMESIPFLLPPPDDQRAIAAVLGSLDDKIEVNRRTARVLEGLARTIFRSWFVDFDPVRNRQTASAAGQPTALPDDLAALFPTRLVNSPLGDIPEGWEVRPLDSIARFLNGLALQKYPPRDAEPTLPVIKIAQLRKGNTVGANLANTEVPEDYVVRDGDMLFSWSGSLQCALWAGGEGALNQHLFKVTSDEFPQWFVYLWVQHHLPEFRRIAAAKATTMGHIQRQHLTQALVAVPPRSTVAAMNELLGPIVATIPLRLVQSRGLARIRDALLPRLVSGDLEVTPSSIREVRQ